MATNDWTFGFGEDVSPDQLAVSATQEQAYKQLLSGRQMGHATQAFAGWGTALESTTAGSTGTATVGFGGWQTRYYRRRLVRFPKLNETVTYTKKAIEEGIDALDALRYKVACWLGTTDGDNMG